MSKETTSEGKNLLLKDELFNKKTVTYLATLIKKKYKVFDKDRFIRTVLKEFITLELKDRIHCLSNNLHKFIPLLYLETIKIFVDSVKNEPDNEKFILVALTDYVAIYGCEKKYLKESLYALGELTKKFSAEDAIRYFINDFPKETYQQMLRWSKSKNEYQQRLASEGLRPKLPWSVKIDIDYKKGIKVLDNLFFNESRYVTRSVANHLNDISKIDPDLVLSTLKRWQKSKKQNKDEMNYVINHSVRTLVKKCHENTFAFLGYNLKPNISINSFKVDNNKINLGEKLKFSFSLKADEDISLLVDYNIIYPMKNNKKSKKTFKLKKVFFKKGETIFVEKSHLFRKMTTKKLYSGEYKIQIQINCKVYQEIIFNLLV